MELLSYLRKLLRLRREPSAQTVSLPVPAETSSFWDQFPSTAKGMFIEFLKLHDTHGTLGWVSVNNNRTELIPFRHLSASIVAESVARFQDGLIELHSDLPQNVAEELSLLVNLHGKELSAVLREAIDTSRRIEQFTEGEQQLRKLLASG